MKAVRVYIGADHAGYELKNHLVAWLTERGHDLVDCGPPAYDADDDYPPYVLRTADRAAKDPASRGVVIGGSGNGEAIAANKVKGVRAALVWSEETAALAREHNDANVISLGARMYDQERAVRFVEIFLSVEFTGAERHARRIAMLSAYEQSGRLPPLPS